MKKLDWTVIDYKDIINDPLLDKAKAILNYRIDEDWQKFFLKNEQFKKLDYKAGGMVYACY